MPFFLFKISIDIAIILLTSLRALDLVIMAFSSQNFYRCCYDIVNVNHNIRFCYYAIFISKFL